MYAHVVNNTIDQTAGVLPSQATRLDDPTKIVLGFPTASITDQQACGWYAVTDVAQPADTPTKTSDRSLTLVANVPTVTWTSRNKTQAEIDATTANTNGTNIRSLAQGAIATNVAALALTNPTAANNTYIALASPTTAQQTAQVKALSQQVNALVAQVRALTQQNNYLIRLALNQFDATT